MRSRYARFHGNRQQQLESLRKSGWQILTIKTAPVVVAFHASPVCVLVKLWRGKGDKPAEHLRFAAMARAESYVTRYVEKVASVDGFKATRNAERKAKRAALKASDHWTVGDVVYNSWGYDQTNVDWYQVVEVKAKSVVLRAIKKNYAETGFLSGHCQPRRNDFCGEPMLKALSEVGGISMAHGAVCKWDGRSHYESHYA